MRPGGIGMMFGFLVCSVLIGLVSCARPPEKTERSYIQIDEFCQEYAELHRRLARKTLYECHIAAGVSGIGEDMERWVKQSVETAFEMCSAKLAELRKAIKRGSVVYDGQVAYRYLRHIGGMVERNCEDFWKRSAIAELGDNIKELFGRDVFAGRLTEGQECFMENECMLGLRCGGRGCPGVCVRLGDAGDSCGEHDDCRAGLVCYANRCTAPSHGTPCRRSSDCPSQHGCVEGLCVEFKRKGERCESAIECEHICNLQEKKCIGYRFVGHGMSCAVREDEVVFCVSGSCVLDGEYVCRPYAKEGESCLVAGMRCDAGLFCSSDGVCRRTPKEGEKCDGFCDHGLYCSNGVCLKQKGVGETCSSGIECRTGVCSPEGRCFDAKQNIIACERHSDCFNWNCVNNMCCSIL